MKMTTDERIQIIGQSIALLHEKVDMLEAVNNVVVSRLDLIDKGIFEIAKAIDDIAQSIEAIPYIER